MSMNSIEKTSAVSLSSFAVSTSGGRCFFLRHHSMASANLVNDAYDVSRSMHSRLKSEYSGWNSPSAAEPYKITLTRLSAAAPRSFVTSSLSKSSLTIVFSLTNFRSRRHRPRNRRQSLRNRLHCRQSLRRPNHHHPSRHPVLRRISGTRRVVCEG